MKKNFRLIKSLISVKKLTNTIIVRFYNLNYNIELLSLIFRKIKMRVRNIFLPIIYTKLSR